MKKIFLALLAFVLFSSHVMYLKLDTYFLEPNTPATIQLFNGTFDKSANVIDRDRMIDASLVGNGNRIQVSESQWSEKDSVTLLNFNTGEAGTWVAGISTAARSIEMDSSAFNTYLEHEGLIDMLDWRLKNDKLDSAAVEKYSKHVKAIFQVGNKKTDDWKEVLAYPIEFIPLSNPYDLHTGDSIQVRLLSKGKPLANQLVYIDFKPTGDGHTHETDTEENTGHGHSHDDEAQETADHHHETKDEHEHDHDSDETHEHRLADESDGHSHTAEAEKGHSHDENNEPHQHASGQQVRTNADGMLSTRLTADGIWYFQTIHLVNTDQKDFTHESNWATLTFEVVHGHDDHSHGLAHLIARIPAYVYLVGSFLLVLVLFFWFKKKN